MKLKSYEIRSLIRSIILERIETGLGDELDITASRSLIAKQFGTAAEQMAYLHDETVSKSDDPGIVELGNRLSNYKTFSSLPKGTTAGQLVRTGQTIPIPEEED